MSFWEMEEDALYGDTVEYDIISCSYAEYCKAKAGSSIRSTYTTELERTTEWCTDDDVWTAGARSFRDQVEGEWTHTYWRYRVRP